MKTAIIISLAIITFFGLIAWAVERLNSIKFDESLIFANEMKKELFKEDLRQLIELSYPDRVFYSSILESWMEALYEKNYDIILAGRIINRAINIYLR